MNRNKRKSEYMAERSGYWTGCGVTVLHKVAEDVRAVEAAGYEWEPEEPLPERLAAGEGIHGPDLWPAERSWREGEKMRTVLVAVRRFNLWPKLTAFAEKPAETGECARCKGDLAYLLREGA